MCNILGALHNIHVLIIILHVVHLAFTVKKLCKTFSILGESVLWILIHRYCRDKLYYLMFFFNFLFIIFLISELWLLACLIPIPFDNSGCNQYKESKIWLCAGVCQATINRRTGMIFTYYNLNFLVYLPGNRKKLIRIFLLIRNCNLYNIYEMHKSLTETFGVL